MHQALDDAMDQELLEEFEEHQAGAAIVPEEIPEVENDLDADAELSEENIRLDGGQAHTIVINIIFFVSLCF